MTDTSSDVTTLESIQPVSSVASAPAGGPSPGIALCLSGWRLSGYDFHVGVLLRLNQLGFLKKLARVSSVSGGSLTAGVLALAWKNLSFNDSGPVAQTLGTAELHLRQRLVTIMPELICKAPSNHYTR